MVGSAVSRRISESTAARYSRDVETFPIIHCGDLERSLQFYRDGFGFSLKFRWPEEGAAEFFYLERNGSGLGLGRPNGDAYGLPVKVGLPATFVLCTYVQDLDRLYAALVERGVRGLSAPADQPWGERIAYVQDPDGYPILVIQAPIPKDRR
jgi:lactoylglutathione lyase